VTTAARDHEALQVKDQLFVRVGGAPAKFCGLASGGRRDSLKEKEGETPMGRGVNAHEMSNEKIPSFRPGVRGRQEPRTDSQHSIKENFRIEGKPFRCPDQVRKNCQKRDNVEMQS